LPKKASEQQIPSIVAPASSLPGPALSRPPPVGYIQALEEANHDRNRSINETKKEKRPITVKIKMILWSVEFFNQQIGAIPTRTWITAAAVTRFEIPAFPIDAEFFSHNALKDALIEKKLKSNQLRLDKSAQDPEKWDIIAGVTTGNGTSVTECDEGISSCTTLKSLLGKLNLNTRDTVTLNMAVFFEQPNPKILKKKGKRGRPSKKPRNEQQSDSSDGECTELSVLVPDPVPVKVS
jgi:hypothetical protein